MIDFFLITSQGGQVLWSYKYQQDQHEQLVNQFLQSVFLEGQGSFGSFLCEKTQFHWILDNKSQNIYIVAYQKMFHISYANELLSKVKEKLGNYSLDQNNPKFITIFQSILSSLEEADASTVTAFSQRRFEETKKYHGTLQGSKTIPEELDKKLDDLSLKNPKTKEKSIPQKSKRTWSNKASKEEAEMLDFCEKDSHDSNSLAPVTSTDESVEMLEFDAPKTEKSTILNNWFKSLTGHKQLDQDNIKNYLANMKDHLIQKNVAANISDNIIESVGQTLMGETVNTFSNLSSMIRNGTEKAIRQILTPKGNIDLFSEIIQVKQMEHRPYIIVFVGVNGVGKSTNLSKICFWILQKRLKVLIAACDTFRSGAVEQLRVHVKNLKSTNTAGQVNLFERGYGKDAAGIAKEAIQHAKTNEYDVVLIDTAGRMQDNEPLMRALAKLVSVNQPDKIIFVGEALVGNEAVDQLTKFNRALVDYSEAKDRKIDGIILTKFDTIDDKVGAALSMTFVSGAPILFVGTGQTYMDLKKMNVNAIVDALLSN